MHSFYLAPGHLDLVVVHGPDAIRFLQGQLTCDVEALADGAFTHGAACNNKGRVYATFLMLRSNDSYFLVFNRGLGEGFAATLKKFLPFYKCTLQLGPSQWQCMGTAGSVAEEVLARHIDKLPAAGAATLLSDGWICKLDAQHEQYLLCSSEQRIADLQAAMDGTVPQGELQAWQLASMYAGHFPLDPQDSEQYTPQELNLEQHGYISFSKGCYTGQEIVARMHYRGKKKKLLYLLISSTYTPQMLATGFDVCDQDGKVLSHTLKQLPAGDGTLASLALLPAELAEQPAALVDVQGQLLDIRPF